MAGTGRWTIGRNEMSHANMVGWSHTAFGKLGDDPDVESLIRRVARAALDDAGLGPQEVDAVFVGVMNNGFSRQGFEAAQVALGCEELRHTPAVRLENACATGSAALNAAADFIGAGRGRIALVVGAEKMTAKSTAETGDILLSASYRKEEDGIEAGFAGLFGRVADAYFQRYGDHGDDLARIAAKNHANGLSNPLAHMRKDFGYEFCRTVSDKNPLVAGPLRRTDCSMISDGAAAVVLADDDVAGRLRKAVSFRARRQANEILPLSRRDITEFRGAALAWRQALADAGLTLADLSLVETHDCFTIAELIQYEAMGLAAPGQGHRVIRDGTVARGGRLPVNLSGGLKSKGHPIGATGVSMHVIAAMQLCGEAGEMQLADASLAGVFNMGGAAVANYVSILERAR